MAPGISPAHADMTGLPPIVMHSAGDDPLRCDADQISKAVPPGVSTTWCSMASGTCSTSK